MTAAAAAEEPLGTIRMMRAAQVARYGDPSKDGKNILTVRGGDDDDDDDAGIPIPVLTPALVADHRMLIKTLAVSLAPGDVRVLSGKTARYQGPPAFPYIPVGDCCGIVQELSSSATDDETAAPTNKHTDKDKLLPFEVGDRVAVRFHIEGPRGAAAEYAVVSTQVVAKVPPTLSSNEAAALASASPAVILADTYIRPGDRVLITGAGGGIGSHLCQLAKRERKASLVVGVGSPQNCQNRLLRAPICCDRAIDYTSQNVFGMEEYQKEPFDVMIDLACGGWLRMKECVRQKQPLIVKSASQGGRYITTNPDTPTYELATTMDMLHVMLFPALWRAIASRMWSRWSLPAYTYALALPQERDVMIRTMELAAEGKLQAVLDEKGPFPFTTEGLQAAYQLQASYHAAGKVVIQISDE